jgi:hypothetical protein
MIYNHTEELKKLYLSNNNWFFPDAGNGSYKTVNDELFKELKLSI